MSKRVYEGDAGRSGCHEPMITECPLSVRAPIICPKALMCLGLTAWTLGRLAVWPHGIDPPRANPGRYLEAISVTPNATSHKPHATRHTPHATSHKPSKVGSLNEHRWCKNCKPSLELDARNAVGCVQGVHWTQHWTLLDINETLSWTTESGRLDIAVHGTVNQNVGFSREHNSLGFGEFDEFSLVHRVGRREKRGDRQKDGYADGYWEIENNMWRKLKNSLFIENMGLLRAAAELRLPVQVVEEMLVVEAIESETVRCLMVNLGVALNSN
ncbi:hypothetical protein EGW08_015839 [Elysia chlorotica]|uniref:Uncharacterized protein n=1 Tax=Elysia chlorotica TaxID=188477 RepID=A0A433T492_ELYCH|nr:hypothetical protein EGW08_015839 [Elysia chlorotica]